MHAMTIDALAGGGRVIIGVGVSGPQIVEGWYGQPWGKPTARLRDYVTIVRKVLDREEPVSPRRPRDLAAVPRARGRSVRARRCKSILHPTPGIPIWLASGGPAQHRAGRRARATAGCRWASGPNGMDIYGDALERGLRAAQRRQGRDDFEIFTGCSVRITDDVEGVLDAMRPLTGMYVGGMGSATHNYHRDAMARRGFPEAAARIHELWLAGRKEEADRRGARRVPRADRARRPRAAHPRAGGSAASPATGATGVIVRADQPEAFELLADLAGTRDTVEADGCHDVRD